MLQIENKTVWKDTEGNVLHAHGGHMLQTDDWIYWYGEDRRDNIYVSCYRSKDMVNWEFCNHIITTQTPVGGIRIRTDLSLVNQKGGKVNLERPKVIYNKITKKYVLWIHYENGIDYNSARLAIASSDRPDGDFTYHGSFNPFGYMSRDCTLWQEADGQSYFISAARDNADLHMYRLTEDYMNVECLVHKLWPGEYREAPVVMNRDNHYYMMSSFCTGWAPNQCKYAVANKMEERWSRLTEIGDKTTFDSQPAFIIKLSGTKATTWLYVGDCWDGKDYYNSRYIFLPLQFNDDAIMAMKYFNKISISVREGIIDGIE